MWQWELQVLGDELLDVWAFDEVGLLEFDDFEDLAETSLARLHPLVERWFALTWTDLNLARCLAAMSWYNASTASVRDISRYSLYMLCVPDRES